MSFGRALLAAFFPRRCIFCGTVVKYSGEELELLVCEACAEKLRGPEERQSGERFSRGDVECAAPFVYEGFVRELLLGMKTARGRGRASYFARFAARSVRAAYDGIAFDAVVCVPKYEPDGRVYNQARVFARRLAEELGLPLRDAALIQTAPKKRQHLLSADERRANVRGVFAVPPGTDIAGKTLLLADDIVTTGSTLAACAAALLDAGAFRVLCIAAAGTPVRSAQAGPDGRGKHVGNSC